MLCNSCRPKLQICPICLAVLDDSRCLIAEKFLEELPQKCCYSKHGCTEMLVAEERLNHEKICQHREVSCPEIDCLGLVPMSALLDHLRQKHPSIKWLPNNHQGCFKMVELMGPRDSIIRRKLWYVAMDVAMEGKYFYISVAINEKKGLRYFWATMIGQKEAASHYQGEISLFNEPIANLRVKHPVLSLEDPWEEVIEKGENVLIVPEIVLKQVCSVDRKTYLKIALEFN